MGYRELIKKVQHDSGMPDTESKDTLDLMVESLAERLNEGERHDFASQLPAELQDIALSVEANKKESHTSIIQEFMEREEIEEGRAKKQVLSAWAAIKSFVSEGEIEHIKAQLPSEALEALY